MNIETASESNKHDYRDATLGLRGRKLGTFEIGRDLGGWIQTLHPKPSEISWQSRALLEKICALSRARRGKETLFVNFDPDQHLMFRYLTVSLGERVPSFSYFSTALKPLPKSDQLVEEVDRLIERRVRQFDRAESLLSAIPFKSGDFAIVLLPPNRPDLQRSVAVQFVEGAKGVMLVRDFSLVKAPWPYDYLRDNNMVMIETADGYGECWAL